MTHLFDSSAILADIYGEPGADRVSEHLVHRDPHFGALPAGRPRQEVLPDKG